LFVCLVPGSQSSIAVAHDEIAVTGSAQACGVFFRSGFGALGALDEEGEELGEREEERERERGREGERERRVWWWKVLAWLLPILSLL
jgi:hypothetical protein